MLGRTKDKESEYWNDKAKKKSHVERQKWLPREEEENKERGEKGKQNKISMKGGGKYSSLASTMPVIFIHAGELQSREVDRIDCCLSRAQFKRDSNYIYYFTEIL